MAGLSYTLEPISGETWRLLTRDEDGISGIYEGGFRFVADILIKMASPDPRLGIRVVRPQPAKPNPRPDGEGKSHD